MDDAYIEALLKRLRKARCWHERDVFGARATKWFDLRSRDVDDAIAVIEQLRAKRKAAEVC